MATEYPSSITPPPPPRFLGAIFESRWCRTTRARMCARAWLPELSRGTRGHPPQRVEGGSPEATCRQGESAKNSQLFSWEIPRAHRFEESDSWRRRCERGPQAERLWDPGPKVPTTRARRPLRRSSTRCGRLRSRRVDLGQHRANVVQCLFYFSCGDAQSSWSAECVKCCNKAPSNNSRAILE